MMVFTLSAWLTMRKPTNPVTWILRVSVMSSVLAQLATDYLESGGERSVLVARSAFFIQTGVFWIGIYLVTVLFLLLFTAGRPRRGAGGWLAGPAWWV